MFRKLDDFYTQWLQEMAHTMRLLQNLTDESLERKITPEGRSLGTLAWHLVTTIAEMGHRAGLLDAPVTEHSSRPATAKEIHDLYRKEAQKIYQAVSDKWRDNQLEEEVAMYGEQWKKGFVLWSLILHQAHHRGQMTVLMRQAGLSVPGIYGPSREEWAQYGMPVQE